MNIINKKTTILFIVLFSIITFIRLFNLSSSPASLYWEEAALGYDAYSILKTNKDFHGHKFPLVAFESFGDYKPSGYFYATALSEKFLGLNTLAVRLPSIISGFIIIIFSYLISLEIFKNNKQKIIIGLISAALVGVSPWAFQFSRAGFEANLATALSAMAIWLLLKSQKSIKHLFSSVVLFAISIYTYHSSRIFTPLFLLIYLLINFKSILKNKRSWLLAGLIGLILTFPIIINLNNPEVKHRFEETSAFSDLAPIIKINQQRADHQNSFVSKIIYHRYWYYTETVIKNIASNLNLNYLLISGDENKRHSTGESGIFYPLDFILIISGLIYLFKHKSKPLLILIFWWLAALVPASLTKTNPHALRSLLAIPAPQILASFGAFTLFSTLKKYKKITLYTFIFIYSTLVFRHYYNYFTSYTKTYASQWQYGYQDLIRYIKDNQDNYDQVFITNQLGRPSIYYFYHLKINPKAVQQEESTAKKDQGERLSFKNINFYLPPLIPSNSLSVTTTPYSSDRDILYIVKDLINQPVFYIYEH